MDTEWPEAGTVPVRRQGATAVELDENVAVYDDVGQLLILLNSSAGSVWKLCDGTTTVDEIVEALGETYPEDASVIGADVRETLRKLADMGLVSEGRRRRRRRARRPPGADGRRASCRRPRPCPGWGVPIARLSNEAGPDDVAAAVVRDGAVIVEGVADPALLERIEAELRPFLDATTTGPDDFSGQLTRRTGSLIARSPACRDLVMHPLALGAARTFLGQATNIQLHLTQAIAIGPGESAQPIHRDQWAFDFFPFPAGYEVQCNTIWALTDFTEENGATRVVVGSNALEDPSVAFGPADTEPAAMPRGSVLFYSGSVYHGGGANDSAATRIGLNITYAVAWLRQEENQYLSVPREVAETLPVDLLRLMGYDRGAYALGYIDDLRDPIESVRPGIGTTGFAAH